MPATRIITRHHLPVFSSLTEQEFEFLHSISKKKAFPKNVILAYEGQHMDHFHVLLSGSVREYLSDVNGKEITLGKLSQSDYFGELPLLGQATQSVSIATMEKVLLVSIPISSLKPLLNQYPDIHKQLTNNLVSKVNGLTIKLKDFAFCDVYHRLVKILQSMATKKMESY